jgi:hypothetical protein
MLHYSLSLPPISSSTRWNRFRRRPGRLRIRDTAWLTRLSCPITETRLDSSLAHLTAPVPTHRFRKVSHRPKPGKYESKPPFQSVPQPPLGTLLGRFQKRKNPGKMGLGTL